MRGMVVCLFLFMLLIRIILHKCSDQNTSLSFQITKSMFIISDLLFECE